MIVVTTFLKPWDRLQVLDNGPAKMAEKIADKTRGLSNYLLFLVQAFAESPDQKSGIFH